MRLHSAFAIIFCFILISCSSKDGSNVIPSEKMEQILIDMHYADTYSAMAIDTLHAIGSKNNDSLAIFYKSILEHHKVSFEEFNESIKWYKLNPEQLDSVYAAMIPQLSKMESANPIK